MVDEGWDILTSKRPLEDFGKLLHQSWESKRSLDSRVSNSEIDQLYKQGIESGALGGKLLGAGGGGYLLFFATPEKHKKLKETFINHQLLDVKINSPGVENIFAS